MTEVAVAVAAVTAGRVAAKAAAETTDVKAAMGMGLEAKMGVVAMAPMAALAPMVAAPAASADRGRRARGKGGSGLAMVKIAYVAARAWAEMARAAAAVGRAAVAEELWEAAVVPEILSGAPTAVAVADPVGVVLDSLVAIDGTTSPLDTRRGSQQSHRHAFQSRN